MSLWLKFIFSFSLIYHFFSDKSRENLHIRSEKKVIHAYVNRIIFPSSLIFNSYFYSTYWRLVKKVGDLSNLNDKNFGNLK